jgi:hypothetical protein
VTLPVLHLADWRQTKDTLHLYAQIVGKVRLATTPPRNHWWNVPLYVDVRGLTTRRLHHAGTTFDITLDLVDHAVVVRTAAGRVERFAAAAGQEREAKLTALFARILDRINAERGRIVAGIERYARKQRDLAEGVKTRSLAVAGRRADASATGASLSDLEETLRWDTRIYDERQLALTYVCESPTLLEQRAFALAREIRSRLD